MKKIYLAQYCHCVHESSYATISIHKTKEGAENAVKKDKEQAYLKYLEDKAEWDKIEPDIPFGEFAKHEDWNVTEAMLEN